jgi:hypothetical protein
VADGVLLLDHGVHEVLQHRAPLVERRLGPLGLRHARTPHALVDLVGSEGADGSDLLVGGRVDGVQLLALLFFLLIIRFKIEK